MNESKTHYIILYISTYNNCVLIIHRLIDIDEFRHINKEGLFLIESHEYV